MGSRATRGFTLLEVMIACAVVAILAGIAMPSYRQYVVRTHRVQAQMCMADQANLLERQYTRALSYLKAPTAACAADLRGYQLQIDVTAVGYTIGAEPVSSQADQACGRLTLDQVGVTSPARSECW